MFEQKQTLSAMPYFQNELLEFDGNNYCVRKKIYKNQEIRFIDSHFIYNSFDASRFSEFMDCCESNRIDAAFLRLSPFCNIDNTPPSQIIKRTFTKNNTCYIDTSTDFFPQISSVWRRKIRKAKRECLVEIFIPKASDLLFFAEKYNEYMKSKSTSDLYYLDPVKFQNLGGCPDILLVNVKTDSQDILVSALFVKYKNIFYYWFSYSVGKAPQGAGQLSIFAACEYANKQQINGLFLGGGMTDKVDDPLWRFKKNFSLIHIKVDYIGLSISSRFQDWGKSSNGRFLPW